ncbi:hypothetical protein KC343_g119 [Hortaea werneckii]|uniref:Uncharacterized protein n=1 Tax=Hortaea werneckii TaxID=91943 RepID=A0A3M7HP62_HORWE|nr:hypothetical protein KC317_g700 [Hortaea werneckii]KAI7628560.1 hypothetical protein KC346_g110 [Hortaea werneckii]KAI7638387.1 hypothetical protein KC343_g119 [Hortaea werneckii]KAI7684102.1 hypothetical protein KC319_g121 [Hortaea werneckii]KAI7724081.1 hypothetical protein KC322_g336 [Hortaea werneckii]
MARRSSARLAGRASTPKRVSLSHDQPQANTTRTPRTVPAKLSSLDENDEMPGAFPQSPDSAPLAKRQRSAGPTDAHTPTENRSIQPSDQEMHPQRLHQTTAKPLDEARHLGFTQMPQTEPAGKKSRISNAQATPSRSTRPGKALSNPTEDAKSPTYQFTFRREHSLELSPDAKRLMLEKREEAQRIREQMVRNGEGSDPNAVNADDMVAGRKLAKPKGRFSEVHGKAFDKMASIAGHKSAFRSKGNGNDVDMKTPQQSKEKTGVSVVEAAQKSLKRSPSKAQLDEPSEKKSLAKSPSKSNMNIGLPRTKQTHTLPAAPEAGPASPSPVKRQRRAEDDNVSSARPSSRDTPSTPQQQSVKKSIPSAVSYPNLSALTTPTQSSLARAASTKKTETKIPGPQLARSPSKPNLKSADVRPQHRAVVQQEEAGPSTPPLLQRSPSKSAHLFAGHTPAHFGQSQSRQPNEAQTGKGESPLLSRTPRHGSPGKKPVENVDADQQGEGKNPSHPAWLARSPHKMSVSRKPPGEDSSKAEQQENSSSGTTPSTGSGTHIPLLSRAPTKPPPHHPQPIPNTADPTRPPSTPGKHHNPDQEEGKGKSGLLSRFSLLRKPHSPMKSILRRSPARLYSDDPAKIAAGTHLASPPSVLLERGEGPKGSGGEGSSSGVGVGGEGGNGVVRGGGAGDGGNQGGRKKEERKRVDFTASTKARYEEGRVGAGGGNGKGLGGLADQEERGMELEGLAREVDEEDIEAEGMDLDTSPPPTALASAADTAAEDDDDDLNPEPDTQANTITYPALSSPAPTAPPSTASMPPSPSPQKRRQTFAPQDFTFRAGSQEIVFGNPDSLSSPGKTGAVGGGGARRRTTAAPTPASAAASGAGAGGKGTGRRATIRAVSAEPAGQASAPISSTRTPATGAAGETEGGKDVPGSRKRKFDFENAHPDPAPVHEVLPPGRDSDAVDEEAEDGGSGDSGKENHSLLPFSARSQGAKAGMKGKRDGPAVPDREDDGEEEDHRPAKRTKTSSSANPVTGEGGKGAANARLTGTASGSGSRSGTATATGTGNPGAGTRGTRRTTLGVKPRGEKKSAALAMAGRRGGPAAGGGAGGGVRRAPPVSGAGRATSGAGSRAGGNGAGGNGVASAAASAAGNGAGKSTISRERLNALAAPKKRRA